MDFESRKVVLFVCKDKGPSQMMIPLAQVLRSRVEVLVVVEGVAAREFKEAGFTPLVEGPFDFTKEPEFRFDEADLLASVNPSAVVIGYSAPINLERTIGYAANKRGVPVVLCADGPGVHNVSDVHIRMALCDEEYTRALIEKDLGGKTTGIVVGSHAVAAAQGLVLRKPALDMFSKLRERYEELFLFVGGWPVPATAELALMVSCLRGRTGSWGLIARHHPKFAGRSSGEDGVTFTEKWRAILSVLGDHLVVEHDMVADVSGEEMVAGVDAVFSGRSTLLTTAAARGIRAISLVTPETLENNRKVLGLEHLSAVASGYTFPVVGPGDLEKAFAVPLPPRERFQAFEAGFAAGCVRGMIG